MDQARKSVLITEVSGVEGLSEAVINARFAATQLAPRACSGRILHADVGGLPFSRGWLDAAIRVRGRITPPDTITLGTLVELAGEVSQWNYDTLEGDIVVFPEGNEEDGCFRGGIGYATVTLAKEELGQLTAMIEGLDDGLIWSRIGRYRADPEVRRAGAHRIRAVAGVLAHQEPFLSPRAHRLLREELIDAFLATMVGAIEAPATRPLNGARVVSLVEDYLVSRGMEPVPLSELCRDLKLARRSLNRAFRDTLGIGPQTYLRLARLSSVRRSLVEAEPGTTSITAIALDHGFVELGRFSVLYREIFGESPSETLRRAPEMTRAAPSLPRRRDDRPWPRLPSTTPIARGLPTSPLTRFATSA